MKKKFTSLKFGIAVLASMLTNNLSAQWVTVGPVSGPGFNVFAMRAMGADLYAGGSGVAKWDGTAWTSLGHLAATTGLGTGSLGINTMIEFGGSLYAGGDFDSIGGVYLDHTIGVAKYNGTTWEKLGAGAPNLSGVTSLAVYHGELYAGGNYGVNKWDGTTWTSVGTTDGPANVVLAVYHDELYAASSFTHIGTATMTVGKGFAKWNGTAWTALPGFFDTLSVLPGINVAKAASMVVFKDELYVMGSLDYAGTTFVRGVGRWNGAAWNPTNGGIAGNGTPSSNAMCIDSNNLYVVGPIQKVNTTNDSIFLSAYWNGTKWNPMFGGSVPYTSFFVSVNYNGEIHSAYSSLVKWTGATTPSSVAIQQAEEHINVYPNPSNGLFNILLKGDGPTQIRVMNSVGQIIYNEHLSAPGQTHTINLQNVSSGVYFVQVSNHSGAETTTLLIKK